MDFNSVLLHNVAERRPMPDGGMRFQRVPESVRLALNEHAQERMLDVAGTEIRFVVLSGRPVVHLHGLAGPITAQVFMGDFRTGQTWTIGPAPVALGIDLQDWFVNLDPGRMGRLGFSPRVVRVFLTGGSVCFHGVEGDVRPPTPAELPSARYLAYGTSITQGASASMRHLAFVAQTSWRLRADAINLGVGSSCACEPAIADYVASRGDWRVATLEHAANMFHWPLNEFRERSADFIERVASGRPDGLLACISAWPKADDMGPEHVSPRSGGSPEQYRAALRDVVARCGRPNVVVIEGPHLLPEMRGLAMDLLHPTDYGHTLIAENLAREFRRLLPAVFA